VKVLDFGISKFLTAGDSNVKTRRGLTMGTPEFMAPEQISDPDAVDSRVDVYALGVIMYHMLAGQHPFTRTPLQSLLTQIVVEPPPPIERQGIPEGLHAIVLKALSKNPADRFASMREMGIELERLSTRIFSGSDWDEQANIVGFDSGSRGRAAPVSGSVPISGSIARPVTRTGPISDPQIGAGVPTSSPVVHVTDPAMAPRGRGLLYVTLALALVAFGGVAVAFLAVRGQRASDPESAPPPAAAVLPPPAAPPAAPSAPTTFHVQINSATAQARVTLRGRTHRLPFADDLKPGSQPEVVELTAPGREGRRFWVTFDHPIALAVDLPAGRGVVEATAEQTVIALGGKSVDGDPAAPQPAAPGSADDGTAAKPAPAGSPHHPGAHKHAAGALALAKATAAPEREPAEAPPEPKPAQSPPPKSEAPAPPAPKPPVAAAASSAAVAVKPAPAAAAAPRPAATGLDRAKTQAFVRSRLPEVQRCYERGKMDEPDLKGNVTLKISVSEVGGVTSAMVDASTLHSSSVESCIVNTVKGWKFPAPSGGPAVISYPFNFR
jgi:serine/threonine-protein kinase